MKFYLNNYRAIFHIINLVIFYFALKLIHIRILEMPILGLILLVANYFISEFAIKKSGMKELYEKEKRKLDEENNS